MRTIPMLTALAAATLASVPGQLVQTIVSALTTLS